MGNKLVIGVLVMSLAAPCHASHYDSPDGRWIIEGGSGDASDDPDPVGRLRHDPRYVVVEVDISKERLLEVMFQNPKCKVVAVDSKRTIFFYYLRDLEFERRQSKWFSVDGPRYVLPTPIEKYESDGRTGGGMTDESSRLYPFLGRKQVQQQLQDGHGNQVDLYINTDWAEYLNDQVVHDLFGRQLGQGFEIVRKDGSTVIETAKGFDGTYTVTWLSKDVVVSIIGHKYCPEAVVSAYLKKYPSSLPKSLTFDLQAWSERQLEISVELMKENIEEPDDMLTAEPTRGFSYGRSGMEGFICDDWWEGYKRGISALLTAHIYTKGNQDFEAYRKGLIELRKQTVAEAEELLKKAKTEGVRFVQVKRDERRILIGRTPEDAEREKKQLHVLGLLRYYGSAGLVVLVLVVVLVKLRASRKRQPPLVARLIIG